MKLKQILITLLLASVLIVVFLISRQAAPRERLIEASEPRRFARADAPHVPGVVLIRFKPDSLLLQMQEASLAQVGAIIENGFTLKNDSSVSELPIPEIPGVEDRLSKQGAPLNGSTESLFSKILGVTVTKVTSGIGIPSKQLSRREREEFIKNYRKSGLDGEFAVSYKDDIDPVALASNLMSSGIAEYATPNYILESSFLPSSAYPNDPFYVDGFVYNNKRHYKWGLKKIENNYAWDSSQGDGVILAVVDTGIDYNHRDLAANIWNNDDEIAGNGIDDDENGLIDDTRGFDFNTCETYEEDALGNVTGVCLEEKSWDNDPMDDNGHGTTIAGVVAAVGNNNYHALGSAFRTTIMPVKVSNWQGKGRLWDVRNGIIYAVNNGADVINLSNGIRIEDAPYENPFFTAVVRYAANNGVVVIAAAGNSNEDVIHYTPANLAETIAVAATNKDDGKASFSNHGDLIDVAAPGVEILTTGLDNGVAINNGTSFSAPFVSGVAALLLSLDPDLTNEQVRAIIRDTTDPVTTDQPIGTGRINARRAVETLTGPADLTITHSAPESVIAGSIFTYTLYITNTGQSAAEFVRTQTLIPAFFNFIPPTGDVVPGQISCEGSRRVQCNVGTLMRNHSQTIRLRFRVPSSECDDMIPIETKIITTSEETNEINNETDFDQPTTLIINVTC